AAMLAQLAHSERQPPAELAELQGRQLAMLIRHHARYSPSFAARLAQAGVGETGFRGVGGLRRVKPLTRPDLPSAGQAFFAVQVPRSHLPLGNVKTSGSTGQPVAIRKTAVNRLMWAALAIRDHIWNGRDFGGRMTAIRANLSAYGEEENWGHPV